LASARPSEKICGNLREFLPEVLGAAMQADVDKTFPRR
jgi:hypothetical protein